MSNSQKGLWALVAIIVIIILAILAVDAFTAASQQTAPSSGAPVSTVQATYSCDGGKTIDATYQNATTATTAGNSVMLVLSDGRQMTLQQAISADGARYASADGSFVFWSKGNGAFITENGTTTYDNCVTSAQ